MKTILTIEGLHEQLVESASTEDEKLKGTIHAIKRYVLPLRGEFPPDWNGYFKWKNAKGEWQEKGAGI